MEELKSLLEKQIKALKQISEDKMEKYQEEIFLLHKFMFEKIPNYKESFYEKTNSENNEL